MARLVSTSPSKFNSPYKVVNSFGLCCRAWVTRCFAAAITDKEKDQMEKQLKEVITHAFSRDCVETTDWTTYPIPQLVAQT